MIHRTFIQTLILVVWASVAAAQSDPVTVAKRAAQMLEKAATQLEQAEKSRDRIAALTDTVRAYEDGLAALREGMRRVAIQERTITLAFEAQEDRLSRLLGVLQTIGGSSAPLLMMHPTGPLGTARSGMILSDVTPALHAEALELKAQLEEVAELRALQQAAADQLTLAMDNMQTARSGLAQSVSDRTELPNRVSTDAEQMTALVSAADTLQGFANSLSEIGSAGLTNPAAFDSAKGKLPLPVRGTLVTGFNVEDAQGLKRPGLTIATQAQALVSAPWPGTVRYAGRLLDYGSVVILEPESGYLMILAGVGQTLVVDGQIVAKGEALALMSGKSPDADSFLISATKGSGGNRQESLYIEIRQGNTPTNPATWFAADKG